MGGPGSGRKKGSGGKGKSLGSILKKSKKTLASKPVGTVMTKNGIKYKRVADGWAKQ